MEQNTYLTPELEILEFESEDVITTSVGTRDEAESPIIPIL